MPLRLDPTLTTDEEFEALRVAGYTTGTLNDRMFAFLVDQGYFGALADMIKEHDGAGVGPSITLTGLTGGNAVIGDEASIGFTISDGTLTLVENRWALESGGEEFFEFGSSPSTLEGYDGSTLWLIATYDDGGTYQTSAPIRAALPTAAGNLVNQSFTINTGSQTYSTAFDFTGTDGTYSVNSVTGVTIAQTGVLTFDTNAMSTQSATNITVTYTNSAGAATSSLDLTIVASEISATSTPTASTLYDEDTLDDTTSIATYQNASNYSTTSGGTLSVSTVYRINGVASTGSASLTTGDTYEIDFVVADTNGPGRTFTISGTAQLLWSLTSIGTNEISVVVESGVPGSKVMPPVSGYTHGKTADDFRNGPVFLSDVTISGDTGLSDVLTASFGLVCIPDGRTLGTTTYQWEDDDGNIGGATSSTFTITAGQQGENVAVTAGITDGVAATVTQTSADLAIPAGGYTQLLYDNQHTAYFEVDTSGDTLESSMTFSIWGKFTLPASGSERIFETTNGKTRLSVNSAGSLFLFVIDSGNTEVWRVTAFEKVTDGTLHHIAFNVDLSGTPSASLEVDGADAITTTNTALIAGTGSINRGGKQRFFTENALSPIADVTFGDLFYSYGEQIALSTFYNAGTPPDISAVGSPEVHLGGSLTAAQITSGSNNGSKTTSVTGTFIAGA